MTTSDLIRKSIIDNLNRFIAPLSDVEIWGLNEYLMGGYANTPPTSIQKEFIDEFIGEEGFMRLHADYKKLELGIEPSFRPFAEIESLNRLRLLISYDINTRFGKLLNGSKPKTIAEKKPKDWNKKLKTELENAIEESYFEGVFDKCDGFCNITDVLIEHKLLKPFKED